MGAPCRRPGHLPFVRLLRGRAKRSVPEIHLKPLPFAILRFNDSAPYSWNIYHCEKKGLLLVRLWKRYLFIDVEEEEVYDLDPQKVTVSGDNVIWSFSDLPDDPINTPDWSDRNIGRMQRLRFRLGKDGHFLELQLPFDINGRPIY